MTYAIEVNNVSKSFNKKPVLSNINFKIEAGEIVALLGKNGAGKTTLIRLLNDLITKDSGTVKIFEQVKPDRNLIGVMSQNSVRLDRVKVKEAVNLARSFYQNPLSFEKLVELAGIETLLDKFTDKLSGGQLKRVSFAIVMAGNPKLVFLDEPTAGMDVDARNEFWQKINGFKKLGITFLITSHYPEELEKVAGRYLIINNHRLVFDGSLEQMKEQNQTAQVKFVSQLEKESFTKLPALAEITENNHHYVLKVSNLNTFLPSFIKYIKQVENLEISQSNLESLMKKWMED
ncbi:ABC transporter ATP-binding protein [Lactobacillus jensenii]|jgi:ABC transporter, ATP-binding protein|uniref:ABC transporter ATP-binding protein n=2 Tax=Lactobacillus jensenii TaxID=109790 RepID=A0A5N1IEU9_LACJE|nr:ABC transporter ATP-binding protein [Lactobacillus jensenii]EEQ69125.1 ABC transporter, ATP-binding protein [Lactobacillus jensenii 1153]APT15051.1 ABC transporter ATP-binding protein [Lactobacillus jensenii]EEQ25193.1 ABC transporter, ATP-binding protein [Lactobacillus jensenii 269-3]EEX26729.1 ABC transporter, ATP-binding protein [Lactobacillus jensenii SJ-7A-US]KAA9235968.1 ABC transporter ATP-binding protein [Lactobacillus jensenii]